MSDFPETKVIFPAVLMREGLDLVAGGVIRVEVDNLNRGSVGERERLQCGVFAREDGEALEGDVILAEGCWRPKPLIFIFNRSLCAMLEESCIANMSFLSIMFSSGRTSMKLVGFKVAARRDIFFMCRRRGVSEIFLITMGLRGSLSSSGVTVISRNKLSLRFWSAYTKNILREDAGNLCDLYLSLATVLSQCPGALYPLRSVPRP